jgi:hypothetical protein
MSPPCKSYTLRRIVDDDGSLPIIRTLFLTQAPHCPDRVPPSGAVRSNLGTKPCAYANWVTSCLGGQFAVQGAFSQHLVPQRSWTRRAVEIAGRTHDCVLCCTCPQRNTDALSGVWARSLPCIRNYHVLGTSGTWRLLYNVHRSSHIETAVRCISGSYGSSDMAETSGYPDCATPKYISQRKQIPFFPARSLSCIQIADYGCGSSDYIRVTSLSVSGIALAHDRVL